jgi:glycosyltransferase involved in cell wall biosynthesis
MEQEADVYHCHDEWALYAGVQIRRELEKHGKKPKLIHDVQEYPGAVYPAPNIFRHLYDRLLRKISRHFAMGALKCVDYIITANQISRGYYLAINRFLQTEVIYNCPVLSIFKDAARKEKKDRIVICHEGFLWFRRGLREMIEAMKMLKKHYGDKVELTIIGDVYGEERKYLEKKWQEYDLHNTIRCTGWLPYKEVGEAMSQTDIGIIFSEPTMNNMLAGPPNKLFNYMRYGLAVVSVDLPETSRIIRETECGLITKGRDSASFVKALSFLIDDEGARRQMGENGRKAVRDKYSWEQMSKRLFRIYAELLQFRVK